MIILPFLQIEVQALKDKLGAVDGNVSKLQRTLAMEQSLVAVSKMAKDDVVDRMHSLMQQVESIHGKWKEEQQERMKRQQALYEKSDEARGLRLELLESQATTRYAPPC